MNLNTPKTSSNGADGLERVTPSAKLLLESKDQLVSDFRAMLSEGEALFAHATSGGSAALGAARDQFREQLAAARERFGEIEDATLRNAKRAATATDQYVHENPWASVALAGGVGLLVDVLISRHQES